MSAFRRPRPSSGLAGPLVGFLAGLAFGFGREAFRASDGYRDRRPEPLDFAGDLTDCDDVIVSESACDYPSFESDADGPSGSDSWD